MPKILLVEDDRQTTSALLPALTANHWLVNAIDDAQTALHLVQADAYDLIMMDVMLPGLDGIGLCRQLRSQGHQVPILMLTPQNDSSDRTLSLEAGADDYVVKPFDLAELIARIRALLRRSRATIPELLTWQGLTLDAAAGKVTYQEQDGPQATVVHLTPKEYGLLELFLRYPTRIFSRDTILNRVWNTYDFPGEKAVNTQILGLRQKLKKAGMQIDPIETVYGLGYRLRAAPETACSIDLHAANLPPPPTATSCGHSSLGAVDPLSVAAEPFSSPPNEAEVRAYIAKIRQDFTQKLKKQLQIFDQLLTRHALELDRPLYQQSRAIAQRLIGTLGSFGLPTGAAVAQQIEQLLSAEMQLEQSQTQRFANLVKSLKLAIEIEPWQQPSIVPTLPPLSSDHGFRQILLIDDDALLAEQIQTAAIWGWQVEIARHRHAAHEFLRQQTPDVILLNLAIPSDAIPSDALNSPIDPHPGPRQTESGLLLLEELFKQNSPIPVIVIAAERQLRDRVAVARLGGRAFLQKPIALPQLLQVITRVSQPCSPHALDESYGKIMVVDDDPVILTNISTMIAQWGFEITVLDDPRRFWDVLETCIPDLLILDIEMPDFTGFDLCQAIRTDPIWHRLPILFLSVHTHTEVIHEGFRIGGDDYIRKPIVEAELFPRLLHWLRAKAKSLNTD